jgi:hypothetical protein
VQRPQQRTPAGGNSAVWNGLMLNTALGWIRIIHKPCAPGARLQRASSQQHA